MDHCTDHCFGSPWPLLACGHDYACTLYGCNLSMGGGRRHIVTSPSEKKRWGGERGGEGIVN